MRNCTEGFNLGFEVADLLVLPVKNITAQRVPGYSVGEADGLHSGEQHFGHHDFRRLNVVTADLVNAQCDRLVLTRVLALDSQYRDAVDKKDHVFPCTVVAVVKIEFFRHLIDVAVLIAWTCAVGVINQRQV